MSDEAEKFQQELRVNVQGLQRDLPLQGLSNIWLRETTRHKYSYNFSWMGRPVIQFPQDLLAMQELIWRIRPEVIVETGIAHGGSVVFYASMLELLGGAGQVVAIDVDIRKHNRAAIEAHPMFKRIALVEGSSIDAATVAEVFRLVADRRAIVALDSNHTAAHVLRELEFYSPLVAKGSYLVVFDTIIDDMPADFYGSSRPWHPGNSPKTAVHQFLAGNRRFEIDRELDAKLLISVAPEGYLRCIEDLAK